MLDPFLLPDMFSPDTPDNYIAGFPPHPHRGFETVKSGVNVIDIKHGIEKAVAKVIEGLHSIKKSISTQAEKAQVATISAGDSEIGAKIAELMEQVGDSAPITVEDSPTFGMSTEIVRGMQFPKGYLSPYMVTDTIKMEAVMEHPAILVADQKISSLQDILPLMEALVKEGKKDLLIIAEEISGEALATLLLNKIRGIFNTLAVSAPSFSENRKAILEDIATLVGTDVISTDKGMKLESTPISILGRAGKVIATKDATTIVDGAGDKFKIGVRIEQLKAQLAQESAQYEKDKLKERLAKLSGGVGILKVGAATETEMKYVKLKIEDAVAATKAALAEGIVPGGGVALFKAAVLMKESWNRRSSQEKLETTPELQASYQILINALEEPIAQIAKNAGKRVGEVTSKLREKYAADPKSNTGYDAKEDEIVADMMKVGIVDPVKVVRSALQNAVSVAAMFLTTEAVVSELPEKKKEMPPMPHGEY